MNPTQNPPPRDQHEIALSLARIEGMLSAQLPAIQDNVKANDLALKAHIADADSRRDGIHSRITSIASATDRYGERIEDVEERQSGQLGRTAQFVAVVGGVLGALALLVPALVPSV